MSDENLTNFRLSLEKFGKLTEEKHTKLIRMVALDVLRRVVLKSPVRTGRFRANWNVGIGSPDLSTTEETANTAMQKGAAVVEGVKDGNVAIYVSNNLDYAEALEHGHSKQAPQGVVGVTVAEMQATMGG